MTSGMTKPRGANAVVFILAVELLFASARSSAFGRTCEQLFEGRKNVIRARLIKQQQTVQAGKEIGRHLDDYTRLYLLPRHMLYEKLSPRNEATKYLAGIIVRRARAQDGTRSQSRTMSDLLKALTIRAGRPIHWVEAGGGFALAMRQMAQREEQAQDPDKLHIKMTNVDLFNWQNQSHEHPSIDYIRGELGDEILDPRYRPEYVAGDIATAKVSEAPDLVTSIESIQYVDDKLAMIINWYNQLVDGGHLIIATEHDWSGWIRNEGNYVMGRDTIYADFIRALREAGIDVRLNVREGAVRGDYSRLQTSLMVIEKKPGTRLKKKVRLQSTWVNPHGYVASYYEDLPLGSTVVEVTANGRR